MVTDKTKYREVSLGNLAMTSKRMLKQYGSLVVLDLDLEYKHADRRGEGGELKKKNYVA